MRVIEQERWPRKEHFQLYSKFEFPHVNICVQLDITELWINRAKAGASPTITLVYTITKSANRVPELRQRIHGEKVIEYEVIHPMITILGDDDLFGVVTLTYDSCFTTFSSEASERLKTAKKGVSLSEFPHDQESKFDRDDLLSITILPWLAFTGFSITRKPQDDCIPLIGFGKVQLSGDRYNLPFFVNFHHALADGLHVARLAKYIQEESLELAKSFG
jgi:chloramphenicol O-acetyltransferase type A